MWRLFQPRLWLDTNKPPGVRRSRPIFGYLCQIEKPGDVAAPRVKLCLLKCGCSHMTTSSIRLRYNLCQLKYYTVLRLLSMGFSRFFSNFPLFFSKKIKNPSFFGFWLFVGEYPPNSQGRRHCRRSFYPLLFGGYSYNFPSGGCPLCGYRR